MQVRVFIVISILKLVHCQLFREYYLFDTSQLREAPAPDDARARPVKWCVRRNSRPLDARRLLGTWYTLYRLGAGLETIGVFEHCPANTFTTPTEAELDGYKTRYKRLNETLNFDEGAVLNSWKNGLQHGIVLGNKAAKLYYTNIPSHLKMMAWYDVPVYKFLNDDYLIYYLCNSRLNVKYLWSRRNNQTDEELGRVLQTLARDVDLTWKQKLCVKKRKATRTPFF